MQTNQPRARQRRRVLTEAEQRREFLQAGQNEPILLYIFASIAAPAQVGRFAQTVLGRNRAAWILEVPIDDDRVWGLVDDEPDFSRSEVQAAIVLPRAIALIMGLSPWNSAGGLTPRLRAAASQLNLSPLQAAERMAGGWNGTWDEFVDIMYRAITNADPRPGLDADTFPLWRTVWDTYNEQIDLDHPGQGSQYAAYNRFVEVLARTSPSGAATSAAGGAADAPAEPSSDSSNS